MIQDLIQLLEMAFKRKKQEWSNINHKKKKIFP